MNKKQSAANPPDSIGVNILIQDSHLGPDELESVTSNLKKHGFTLKEDLSSIGVLTGTAPADALPALNSVAGVAQAEESREDYHTQA